ncbi:MAG TPA: DinB family protein [Blastocatellia bacterium]|nr:DinB family protein [Blastocatellia bacterium]
MKAYRKGGIGALMDEYERATAELKILVEQTPDDDYIQVLDARTKDEDCRTIQTILTHVVRSGFGYANYIRDSFSIPTTRSITGLLSRQEAVVGLDEVLGYTAQTLEGKWEMTDEEIEAVAIQSRWGVTYTLEQLLEHAIVHILRHRRQIERLLQESRSV